MTSSLEVKLGILTVEEAIAAFEERYPGSDWNKLQIEHKDRSLNMNWSATMESVATH